MSEYKSSWNAGFVSRFLDSLDKLYDALFQDLCFKSLKAGRPLSISLDRKPIRYLKIGLAEPGIFHLSTVHLYDKHGMLKGDQLNKIKMTLSTTHETIESSVKKLLNEGGIFSFHTKKDDDPYVTLDLQDKVDVKRLLIGNRDDAWAVRAWDLYVDASTDGKKWEPLYSARDRWAEFKALAGGKYYPMSGEERSYARQLVDMYIDVKRCDQVSVRKKSKEYDLSVYPASVKKLLNERMFHRMQLEFTSHGIFKSFRFWKQEAQESYLQYAIDATNMLQGCSKDVCLGYGSVLGLVREQAFIPHDDDLDIIMTLPAEDFSTFKAAIEHVKSYAESAGFTLWKGKFPAHFKLLSPNWVSLDIFVGFKEGDFVSWLPGPRGTLRYDEVFPPISADLYGKSCLIPRNPFSYLEKVYGPEWHTSNSSWQHDWSIDDYRDLF